MYYIELYVSQLPPLDCEVFLDGSHILSSLHNSSFFLLLFPPLKHLSNTYYALGTVLGFPGMTKTMASLQDITNWGQTKQMCIPYCYDVVR